RTGLPDGDRPFFCQEPSFPMSASLTELLTRAQAEFAALGTRPEFEAAKARFVGPNGELTALLKGMGALPKEERPAFGKRINEAKVRLQAEFDAALARIAASELAS